MQGQNDCTKSVLFFVVDCNLSEINGMYTPRISFEFDPWSGRIVESFDYTILLNS
jgi:hypothetical protein